MKLSEAIKQLQAIKKECGDIEIVDLFEEDEDFGLDHNVWFEVIEVPNEAETQFTPHVILNYVGKLDWETQVKPAIKDILSDDVWIIDK